MRPEKISTFSTLNVPLGSVLNLVEIEKEKGSKKGKVPHIIRCRIKEIHTLKKKGEEPMPIWTSIPKRRGKSKRKKVVEKRKITEEMVRQLGTEEIYSKS